MSKLWLLSIGMVFYFWFLLSSMPITHLISWLALPIQAASVSGELGEGRALDLDLGAGITLSEIHWQWRPWRLLLGQVGFAVDYQLLGGKGDAGLSVNWRQQLSIDDADYRLQASELVDGLALPLVELDGVLRLKLDTLVMTETGLGDLSGVLLWNKAKLSKPFAVQLGRYTVDMSSDDEGQLLDISSEGGQLEIGGDIRLQSDGRYATNLQLRPRSSAPKQLTDYLNLFAGRPNNGAYAIRQSGMLSDLGGF